MSQCGVRAGKRVRSKSIPSLRIQRKSSSDSHAECGCAEIARTSAAHPPKRTRQHLRGVIDEWASSPCVESLNRPRSALALCVCAHEVVEVVELLEDWLQARWRLLHLQ